MQRCGGLKRSLRKSPLIQRHLDLFTEIATKGVAKNTVKCAESANDLVLDAKKDATASVVKGAAAGVAQSAAEQALQNAVPMIRAAGFMINMIKSGLVG